MTLLAKYRWIKLLNEAWMSPLNPIEYYIGLIKRHYYKQKTKIGCNPAFNEQGKNTNEIFLNELIVNAFDDYRDFDCYRIVNKCKLLMHERLLKFGYIL